MNQFSVDTYIKNGHLELDNIPFSDETEVKVLIIPKVNLSKLSFNKVKDLTGAIKANLSDSISEERDDR